MCQDIKSGRKHRRFQRDKRFCGVVKTHVFIPCFYRVETGNGKTGITRKLQIGEIPQGGGT